MPSAMDDKSERTRAIRKAQFNLFDLQANEKKIERSCNELEQEIHREKIKIAQIQAELQNKEKLLESTKQKLQFAQEESARAKKQMNTL